MSWWNNYPWRMVQTLLRETDMDGFDAERYAAALEEFGASVVTLNAGGILANYPSRLEYQAVNPYLTGSSLAEILESCHKRGIRVIARMDFSKIPYALYEQHPDWAFRTADGGIIEQNGFVSACQNGEYQQEKALEILTELFGNYPFDGLYCNMSGFFGVDYSGKTYGLCTCEACRTAFQRAFGMEAPTEFDMKKPECMKYLAFQSGAGKKLREKLARCVKAINPEIAVDKIDYLRTESHTEIGEPVWFYSASSNSRLSAGPLRTLRSDNASADFMSFRYRESSVSPGVQELRQWQNLANAGAVSAFIVGRPDNHRDRSWEACKKVFTFHKAHEQELAGLTSAAEVLLVSKSQAGRSDPESYGWIRALSAGHVPFDEARTSGLSEALLRGKRLVILADAKDLGAEAAALLDGFAQSGGTVLASGASGVRGKADSLRCLGLSRIAEKRSGLMSTVFSVSEEDAKRFVRCADTPLIAPGDELYVAELGEDVEAYFTLLPEPRFGPPEVCYATAEEKIPGVTVHSFGEGRGIWVPWSCGAFYHAEGYTNTLNFMHDLLFGLCGLPQLAPKLHPSVELVYSQKENTRVISLINGSGYFGNSFFEPLPICGAEIALPGVKAARALNGGRVTLSDGKIILDCLHDFEMIIAEV